MNSKRYYSKQQITQVELPLTGTWTPEKKREYARARYRRLKALKDQKLPEAQHSPVTIESTEAIAKEELRRMARWLLLESRKYPSSR